MAEQIFVGGGGKDYSEPQNLLLKYGNRHGMIAGATGTGKTVTLQILAESFSEQGVPVFMADVKGDLSGIAKPGSESGKLHNAFMERAEKIGFSNFTYSDFPVVFWDLFGKMGHPIRTTIAEMGPLLLSRLMGLSEAQEGVLNIAFRISDEQGMLLLDLKDLRALLIWMGENSQELSLKFGNISTASVGAIQRELIVLENQGADKFFSEPALDLADMMAVDNGKGRINILAADSLMASPALYSTFLLWLLSELFENLPEVGDPEKPKFVFFFDEAHLLFRDAPKALVNKVEQVARLIRSKGVGVYFISQNPDDIPENILGQLGNRVQHALRAFTPRDQKALALAADTFRPNPDFDTEDAIKSVGVGEAVVSLLENKGIPSIVQRTLIRPPSSQLGPISTGERASIIAMSPVAGKYETEIDRESAFEVLNARAEEARKAAEASVQEETAQKNDVDRIYNMARRFDAGSPARAKPQTSTRSRKSDTITETMVKSMVRSVGTRAGTAIVRSVMGGLFKGR